MLVVISDLHLNDGSAAPENIKPAAFAIWLEDVIALARKNQAKELVFLYLGDMVDLLRTRHWFYPAPGVTLGAQGREDFPAVDRPWGDAAINQHPDEISSNCRARALAILQKICIHAAKQLACLRGEAAGTREALAALGIPVHRLYVPGNHDRLFWIDSGVRQGILDALGASQVPGDRPFELLSLAYGIAARHGHEWDVWNFEAFREGCRPADLTIDDYKLVPIGDPITTELLTRLPYTLSQALPAQLPDEIRANVCEQLSHIEDVRPLHQALRWVLHQPDQLTAEYDQATRDTILDTLGMVVKQVLADFMRLPFVTAWLKKHDRWNLKLDEADKLQDLYRLSKIFDLKRVSWLLAQAEKLGLSIGDDDAFPAERELGEPPRARYCVNGHTHTFRHVPMGRTGKGKSLVYFNAGTWRPRVTQTSDHQAFHAFKEMTYLVFYREDEDRSGPDNHDLSYELWNGIMVK